jgi:mRNA-degrading endonuclease RelE of RelBE toxin-antitoxin system
VKYRISRGFEKILRRLRPPERMEVQRHVDALVRAFEADTFPIGLGLRKLGGSLWEFRINLSLRILFQWEKQSVTFLFIGNHNEVQQFVRHYV